MTAAGAVAAALRSGEIEVTRLAGGSGVVLHVASLRSRTLNPSAMALLEAIEAGGDTVAALAARLTAAHGIGRATAEADVEAFLAELLAVLGSAA